MGSNSWCLALVFAGMLFAGIQGEVSFVARHRPRYARVGGDIETVWQPPVETAKGIVFVAHGCMHQGTDIFSDVGPDGWRFEACSSSNFGRCLGLPEEVRLRQAARKRGYLVMAISGGSGRQSCWRSQVDVHRAREAIQHVKSMEGLPEDSPVLAIGASSGGAFVGHLAAPLSAGGLPHLQCIVSQIMSTRHSENRGVPTMFVHMPQDGRTAQAVSADILRLQKEGIRTAEIKVEPSPVTPELLAPCIGLEVAQDVVTALHGHGLVNEQGFLELDSRARRWVRPVRHAIAGRSDDTLDPDESCVSEILNVAWASHEFTSQHTGDMLDFCEEHGLVVRDGAHAQATKAEL